MLTARTLSPLSDSISMMHITVSYRMAWPTFLVESVLVATCKYNNNEGSTVLGNGTSN